MCHDAYIGAASVITQGAISTSTRQPGSGALTLHQERPCTMLPEPASIISDEQSTFLMPGHHQHYVDST